MSRHFLKAKSSSIHEVLTGYSVMWECEKGHKNFQTVFTTDVTHHDICLKCGKHYEFAVPSSPVDKSTENALRELSEMNNKEFAKNVNNAAKILCKHLAVDKPVDVQAEFAWFEVAVSDRLPDRNSKVLARSEFSDFRITNGYHINSNNCTVWLEKRSLHPVPVPPVTSNIDNDTLAEMLVTFGDYYFANHEMFSGNDFKGNIEIAKNWLSQSGYSIAPNPTDNQQEGRALYDTLTWIANAGAGVTKDELITKAVRALEVYNDKYDQNAFNPM